MKDNKEEGRNAQQCQKEIFDFINGAIYAIDGDIRKISDTIFVIAPPNVDIDSNINQEFEKKEDIDGLSNYRSFEFDLSSYHFAYNGKSYNILDTKY